MDSKTSVMVRVLILVAVLLTGCDMGYDGKVRVVFEPSVSPQEQTAQSEVKRSGVVAEIAKFLNNEFYLPDNLVLRIGSPDGPQFDNRYGEIEIPYRFITETKYAFRRGHPNKSEEEIYNATMDVLMHVMLHEVGHALIDLYELPIIRNEEKEVDDLAAILLVEMFEDGGKIVMNAADSFGLRSGTEGRAMRGDAYAGEHGWSIDRFYNMACLVYGKSPKKMNQKQSLVAIASRDVGECKNRYKMRKKYWIGTLKPNLKNKSNWR